MGSGRLFLEFSRRRRWWLLVVAEEMSRIVFCFAFLCFLFVLQGGDALSGMRQGRISCGGVCVAAWIYSVRWWRVLYGI